MSLPSLFLLGIIISALVRYRLSNVSGSFMSTINISFRIKISKDNLVYTQAAQVVLVKYTNQPPGFTPNDK